MQTNNYTDGCVQLMGHSGFKAIVDRVIEKEVPHEELVNQARVRAPGEVPPEVLGDLNKGITLDKRFFLDRLLLIEKLAVCLHQGHWMIWGKKWTDLARVFNIPLERPDVSKQDKEVVDKIQRLALDHIICHQLTPWRIMRTQLLFNLLGMKREMQARNLHMGAVMGSKGDAVENTYEHLSRWIQKVEKIFRTGKLDKVSTKRLEEVKALITLFDGMKNAFTRYPAIQKMVRENTEMLELVQECLQDPLCLLPQLLVPLLTVVNEDPRKPCYLFLDRVSIQWGHQFLTVQRLEAERFFSISAELFKQLRDIDRRFCQPIRELQNMENDLSQSLRRGGTRLTKIFTTLYPLGEGSLPKNWLSRLEQFERLPSFDPLKMKNMYLKIHKPIVAIQSLLKELLKSKNPQQKVITAYIVFQRLWNHHMQIPSAYVNPLMVGYDLAFDAFCKRYTRLVNLSSTCWTNAPVPPSPDITLFDIGELQLRQTMREWVASLSPLLPDDNVENAIIQIINAVHLACMRLSNLRHEIKQQQKVPVDKRVVSTEVIQSFQKGFGNPLDDIRRLFAIMSISDNRLVQKIQKSITFLEVMGLLVESPYFLQDLTPILTPSKWDPKTTRFYDAQLRCLDDTVFNFPTIIKNCLSPMREELQDLNGEEKKTFKTRMGQYQEIFNTWGREISAHDRGIPLEQKIHRFLCELQKYRKQIVALQHTDDPSFLDQTDKNQRPLWFIYSRMDQLIECNLFSFARPLVRHLEEQELLREPVKIRPTRASPKPKETPKSREKAEQVQQLTVKRPPPQLDDLLAAMLPALSLCTDIEASRIHSLIDLYLSLAVLKKEPLTVVTVRNIFSKYAAFLEQAATLRRGEAIESNHDLLTLLSDLTEEETSEVGRLRNVVSVISRYHYQPGAPLSELLASRAFYRLEKNLQTLENLCLKMCQRLMTSPTTPSPLYSGEWLQQQLDCVEERSVETVTIPVSLVVDLRGMLDRVLWRNSNRFAFKDVETLRCSLYEIEELLKREHHPLIL
ncbi:MAG: hypothetical protein KDK65_05225, partial [Chlamydiia bacterium]|nr:hypothetical protein [Chlamydiia bacterium]